MNITQEKVTDLNSILKVKLGPEDYQQRVDVQLKELQRKASMPGFRPGKLNSGRGVSRSLPRDLVKSRNSCVTVAATT
jgi:hypothetical protein